MDEGYQKELFEFEEKPKKPVSRFGSIFQNTGFENRFAITITMERLIFISIGLIMVMVIVYALGVERGRSSSSEKREAIPAAVKSTKPATAKHLIAKPPMTRPIVAKKEAAEPIPDAARPMLDPAKPYTIVVVTFSRKGDAETEAGRLKKEGYDAFVYYSEPYFQVRVGAFVNGENARSALSKIKRRYKDAYIKLQI